MQIPKLDTLIIAVFLICIALWMTTKCGSRRSEYLQRAGRTADDTEREERPVRRDTVRVPTTPVPTPSPAQVTTPATTPAPVTHSPASPGAKQVAPSSPGAVTAPVTTAPTTTTTPTTPAKPALQRLFVTIDQLKMRKEPGLKGAAIHKLDLYEQVFFMGEKTDWKQEISLGTEKVTDRWVKIKTQEGKVGWVFGAGVNYYKEKRKGVLE
jgi:Bacterial SH3 domain